MVVKHCEDEGVRQALFDVREAIVLDSWLEYVLKQKSTLFLFIILLLFIEAIMHHMERCSV